MSEYGFHLEADSPSEMLEGLVDGMASFCDCVDNDTGCPTCPYYAPGGSDICNAINEIKTVLYHS